MCSNNAGKTLSRVPRQKLEHTCTNSSGDMWTRASRNGGASGRCPAAGCPTPGREETSASPAYERAMWWHRPAAAQGLTSSGCSSEGCSAAAAAAMDTAATDSANCVSDNII